MDITTTGRVQAWEEARKLLPSGCEPDLKKDYASSTRAGHDIYTYMTSTYHCRIDDLNDRLRVYIGEYDESANEFGGTMTNIWIKEDIPGIIPDIGTNMSQNNYDKLCGKVNQWEITDEEAILYINSEFGFEASKIEIVSEVETFISDNNRVKTSRQYIRSAQFRASDYNYIRFDVSSWHYEMINGRLHQYYD